jgi:hypothetical protein
MYLKNYNVSAGERKPLLDLKQNLLPYSQKLMAGFILSQVKSSKYLQSLCKIHFSIILESTFRNPRTQSLNVFWTNDFCEIPDLYAISSKWYQESFKLRRRLPVSPVRRDMRASGI